MILKLRLKEPTEIFYRLITGVNDKSVGYALSSTPPSFGVSICISAYFHPISNFTWKIKKKEIKAKTEKKNRIENIDEEHKQKALNKM